MQIIGAILARSSARKLEGPGPNEQEIEQIISCAAAAPDHGRLEPWRFVVITGEGRERLGEAMARARQRRAPDSSELTLRAEREKPLRAPTIIAVAARIQPGRIPASEQVTAVAAGVQNMFLAALDLGYGAMWKTGDAAYDPDVKVVIGLDPADEIVAFLYLGRTALPGQPRKPSTNGHVQYLGH